MGCRGLGCFELGMEVSTGELGGGWSVGKVVLGLKV